MNTPFFADGSVPLTHWGLIRARGADALKFLQSQLTNDLLAMPDHSARLAGFCSAKGRLQASFIVWKFAPDEVLLACAASVLPATLKRLSMFVMRAQCKLSDEGGDLNLHGAVGASARGLVADAGEWGARQIEGGTLMRLPDVDGTARCMLALDSRATAPQQASLSLDTWRWLEVRSGLPLIEAATAEQFVPQMLNYELVGGVDFQKGCYPGQEVVARSQYRGTIKRRMFLFDCDAPALAGQEVFHSGVAEQPAGMVVNAAPRPDGTGSAMLVEVKLAALTDGSLHLGAPAGSVLLLGQLPYPVPIEPVAAA